MYGDLESGLCQHPGCLMHMLVTNILLLPSQLERLGHIIYILQWTRSTAFVLWLNIFHSSRYHMLQWWRTSVSYSEMIVAIWFELQCIKWFSHSAWEDYMQRSFSSQRACNTEQIAICIIFISMQMAWPSFIYIIQIDLIIFVSVVCDHTCILA